MQTDSFFYCNGGWTNNQHNYVSRNADAELLHFCRNQNNRNSVALLLAPRQMGKTSLMNNLISQLKSENVYTLPINVQGWVDINEEALFLTILFHLFKEIPILTKIEAELNDFWHQNQRIVLSDRFLFFILDKVLPILDNRKLIIFIDEVQSLVRFDLQDKFVKFLKSFSECHHSRLHQINFVLIGVAKPSEFVVNLDTRFSGLQINLECLSGECLPLQEGLKPITTQPSIMINRVLYWTGGQPFLTQYMCYLLVEQFAHTLITKSVDTMVDDTIQNEYIRKWRSRDLQSHLVGIENYFVKINNNQIEDKRKLLNYYESILTNGRQRLEQQHDIQEELLMSGLVIKIIEDNRFYLKIANPIYENIFNYQWIDEMRERLTINHAISNNIKYTDTDEDNNQIIINQCVKILEEVLQYFIKKRMEKYLREGWGNSREIRMIIRPANDESPTTVVNIDKLITIIDRYWDNVFIHVFNTNDKKEFTALLKFCQTHQSQLTDIDNISAVTVLNTIVYLLRAIGYLNKAQAVDELMMNKYPNMRNYFLDRTCTNTLGSTEYSIQEANPSTDATSSSRLILSSNTQVISNNMDRSSRIQNILDQRHPRGQKVGELIGKLNSLSSHLETMQQAASSFYNTMNDVSVANNISTLFPIFLETKNKIEKVNHTLGNLKTRFYRDSLAIAFVGSAGQGKSRLIQTITGLTREEVPDGTMNNCTGVRVIIAHSSNSQTHGEVYLHTPESFLEENIKPYYPVLSLGNPPRTLDEFINNPLPQLRIDTAKAKAYYDHLVKCKDHYRDYEQLLHQNSPLSIEKNQIREYVAQTSENNQRNNFNYLGVKEVKIYCQFPHQDLGKIALIDLPGLGDTVLGDRETLRRSLGEDVDFALFVNMPKGKILQEEDYNLFDTANQALPDLPINQWSFMVLNEVIKPPEGLGIRDNRSLCEETKRRIEDEQRIQVAKCVIADCADSNQVSEVILMPMLQYLETHILELDAKYAAVANQLIQQLEQEIKSLLDKANKAFIVAPKYQNENLLFLNLATKLTRDINRNLKELLQGIRPQTLIIEKNQKDIEFFQDATRSIIKKCQEDTGIHSVEKINDIRYNMETGGWVSVLQRCTNELRNHISKKFTSFDSGFESYVDQVKQQLSQSLTNTELGNITSARGIDFLEFLAQEIPEAYSTLKEAFKEIVDFKITYQYHLKHLILQALEEELEPNLVANIFDPVGKTDQENIEIIHNILFVKHRNTISKCRIALGRLQGMPSIIVYAQADSFVDAITGSEEIQNVWLALLTEWSSLVFPDHFGKETSKEKQQWEDYIQKAIDMSRFQRI